MQSYPGQGNPLLDALEGRISTRQLRVMIEHLPPGNNAVSRQINGRWSDLETLLWHIDSDLRFIHTSFKNANRAKGVQALGDPELIPIPGENSKPTDARSKEQVVAEQDHLQAVLKRSNPR